MLEGNKYYTEEFWGVLVKITKYVNVVLASFHNHIKITENHHWKLPKV